ncbi:MAG: PDZ domain-containing protein [Pirellulales bacterium]|nr:PDZ domain-containing protein [Pirellulales bacterium]
MIARIFNSLSPRARLGWIILALSCAYPAAGILHAEESTESAAEQLVAATVTVRLGVVKEAPAEQIGTPAAASPTENSTTTPESAASKPQNPRPAEEITVCSGVSLGRGLIVTYFEPPADLLAQAPRVRVTLTGGEQATAHIRVVDRYSNLMLLEIANQQLPGLKLADKLPKVGSPVLTAAGAGTEQPAVSLGILSATDRSLVGTDLPPVVQCDLRTTETSCGAGVVNRSGELLGILVATSQPGQHTTGWSYALDMPHLARLLRSHVPNKTLELKRMRPMVGFTLGAGEEEGVVVVERVQAEGPAAAAGILVGDKLVETEGIKIRSAYQAIDLILHKQPGDTIRLRIARGGDHRDLTVRLAGDAVTLVGRPNPATPQGVQVGSAVKATVREGKIAVQNGNHTAEVAVDGQGAPRRSPGDEVEMLRLQLQAFERVLLELQKENATLRAENQKLRTTPAK